MRSYFWQKDNIYLDGYYESEDICLNIYTMEGNCVGFVKLDWINERSGSTGIYVEISHEYRRNGYGSTAMEIMMEYAFEERRMHKINACSKSDQAGAEHFMYQLGFVFEAERKNMFIINGKKLDEYYYGITEDEYRSKNRIAKAHHQAPHNYKTPLENTLARPEKKVKFSYVDYFKEKDGFHCNGLLFRGTRESDCLENQKMIYDSQVCRWFDDDVKLPLGRQVLNDFEKSHLNLAIKDNRLEFAVECSGEYIGCVSLCGIEKEHRRVSASIYIKPDCRKKGVGTKAMRFAISYAAKEFGCTTVIVCVSDGNIASAKMMLKLGMRPNGVQRESAFTGGKYVDTLFFEL